MIATREGVLPVLFTEGATESAPVLGQLALVRHLARQGYSPSQQLKITESLGRFCDWVRFGEDAASLPALTNLPEVLRRFLIARYNGTVGPDDADPTGLMWLPAKASTVEADRRNLAKMSDFAAAQLGALPLGGGLEIKGYTWDGPRHRASVVVLRPRRDPGLLAHLAHLRRGKPSRAVGPVRMRHKTTASFPGF